VLKLSNPKAKTRKEIECNTVIVLNKKELIKMAKFVDIIADDNDGHLYYNRRIQSAIDEI
jgi:hypothetical protein